MTGSQAQTLDSDDPSAVSAMTLSPRVEITVERLEGIIWSTRYRPSSREELQKRVPFVTAAVEFAGTCPNMKIYSASSFPHSKNPAVESYFASLESDAWGEQEQFGFNEVKRIISTTTQEIIETGTTTKTTTTTITTTTTPIARKREGQYNLVAKWHDDSCDDKLIDSITYFTSPPSYDDSESRSGTFTTSSRNANRPHLTLTLPTAAEKRELSVFPSIFSSCHHRHYQVGSNNKQVFNKGVKDLMPTKTNSTAASTVCSSSARYQARNQQQSIQSGSQGEESSWPFQDLGSLLDQDYPVDEVEREEAKPPTKRLDEADVSPLIATQKSKELAATAIAAEPSSAILGQANTKKGAFTPVSWMGCGTASPEIVEIRVRVMPEDADDFDEMDPETQHLAAAQDLEGVAHLVFLDQIIEEGTTVMDLPLKLSQENKAVKRSQTSLSTTPAVGEQDFVTLGANAMLRVRVSILPQGRKPMAPLPQSSSLFDRQALHQSNTMKTHSLPDASLPFYSRPFLRDKFIPLVERVFQTPSQYLQFASERFAEVYYAQKKEEEEDTAPQRRGPFPHEFPTVTPDEKNKKVDSKFLGDWKTYGETWSWLRFSSQGKGKDTGDRATHASNRRKRGDLRHENKKFYVPRSSSTVSESSEEDESDSLLAETDDLFTFTRSLQ
jgi:hypothetical protein